LHIGGQKKGGRRRQKDDRDHCEASGYQEAPVWLECHSRHYPPMSQKKDEWVYSDK
jgi:hypothetical protein